MKAQNTIAALLFLVVSFLSNAQTAKITGVILDEDKKPVQGVSIYTTSSSTLSTKEGFYLIEVPLNQRVILVFTHPIYKKITASFNLKQNEVLEFNPVISSRFEQIDDVVITNNKRRVQGIASIEPEIIRKIPGANAGVESILKTFAGVNSNNELSSGYNVRGGNFDENLVYVNEIEIYRPFLIRSGQQEGLSFTNSDLIQNVDFSAGGFQSKFGDKMSSVLDITYRKPTKFGATFEGSFLGASVSVDLVSKNKKWSAITGVRYRDNSLLVNSQETQTNFRPTFVDVQTNINYMPSTQWQFSFLGNISQNKYNYQPLTRQTNFGTINEPIALQIFYEGQENDAYKTLFGAFKTTFLSNESSYKLILSAYHTQEQEHFDIDASYFLGEIDSSLGSETVGQVTFNKAIGSQLNHARNDLDALIFNAEIKGMHNTKKKFPIEWGLKYTHESIRDRIVEWEVIDSAGFSLNPPIIDLPTKDQPYHPFIGPLVPFQNVRATNFVNINRFSGYTQFNTKTNIGESEFWINAGVRFHSWLISGDAISNTKSQTVFSPRAQFSLKPKWKQDMLFRFSTGFYYQPPFYRELRDQLGAVQPNVKAQKSIHFVLSNDYNFKIGDGEKEKKFKLVSEVFYKSMDDVNTYTLENVRIRYRANNEATAYAYGFDCRINGEFVKGTESWFSFGYLKTEENQNNKGFIARPTDQLLKFGILFQDYMPSITNLKLYLNLVYNTGLPGGSPSYADVYQYQNRLRDYRRADVGFSYVFTEKNSQRDEKHWLKKFKDLSLGFEIFNIFNNQNAITNTWVRDVDTKNQYGIPNYMTTRVFNLKLSARL